MPIKYHAMTKTYREVEKQLHSLLTLALYEGYRSAQTPVLRTPR
jgi:hypothetical protein